jgi:hypothetical protein
LPNYETAISLIITEIRRQRSQLSTAIDPVLRARDESRLADLGDALDLLRERSGLNPPGRQKLPIDKRV